MAMIRCPKRVVKDGRLVAYEGMPITEEQAAELGLLPGMEDDAEGGKPSGKKASKPRSDKGRS